MSPPKWITDDIIRETLYRVIERVSLRNRTKYAMDTAVEITDSVRYSIRGSEGDIRVRIMV